jgi:hypothetical protein
VETEEKKVDCSSSYVNACWVLGQLLASIGLRATMSAETEWSYRIPIALQWIFPLPILVAVYFAPESPWWLIRQSSFDAAKHNLRRLRSKLAHIDEEAFEESLDKSLQDMHETNEKERNAQSGTRYIDCFKGTDRRRTEIACMCWIIQTLCGSTFMGFSTYFCKPSSPTPPPSYMLTHNKTNKPASPPPTHLPSPSHNSPSVSSASSFPGFSCLTTDAGHSTSPTKL